MPTSPVRKVLVVGAGTMGQQIAVQCRRCQIDVRLFDSNPQALQSALASKSHLTSAFGVTPEVAAERARLLATLTVETDPARAAADIDLLIESVPEKLASKRAVFQQFHALCPPHTLFATNTSTLLPSAMAEATGRPELFAALHFNLERDLVEIMPHTGTAESTVQRLRDFVIAIQHLPIDCRTEHPGFVFNNLLMALNATALSLAATGVADYVQIDRAWMKAMRADIGPFGILDGVGLDTAWRITAFRAQLSRDPLSLQSADYLKTFVDQGRLGVKSGRGFYTYPDPEYSRPEFLQIAEA